MKVLVTGSTGFVGSRVVELSEEREWEVVPVVRKTNQLQPNSFAVPSIDSATDWSSAFEGVDCIVHCAARVHQMNETEQDALLAYRGINTLGTLNLAKQAAEASVKGLYLSARLKLTVNLVSQIYPLSRI